MKRRIISSLLAIILMISVVAVGASAAAAVDLSDYTASDSTVDFHIKEIYSRIDVAEYRALDEGRRSTRIGRCAVRSWR